MLTKLTTSALFFDDALNGCNLIDPVLTGYTNI